MLDVLLRLFGVHVHVPVIASIAVILVVALVLGLVVAWLWPRSKGWAAANRLHALASRNEREMRRETRTRLEGALRCLKMARRESESRSLFDDAKRIDLLIRQIELLQDRVISAYSPSVANLSSSPSVTLELFGASEALSHDCEALYEESRSGTSALSEIDGVEESIRAIESWGRLLS